MDTVVYFMIHAEDQKLRFLSTFDSLQTMEEKSILTIKGEEDAKKKSENMKYKNIDRFYSSNYVSTIGTSKYFSNRVGVIDMFGEHKIGNGPLDKVPEDFIKEQFQDFDLKFNNGESLYDTQKRMFDALNLLLEKDKGKTIMIFTHKIALLSLLENYTEISLDGELKFNDEVYFNGKINYLETFRLTFDEKKKLKYIEHIED